MNGLVKVTEGTEETPEPSPSPLHPGPSRGAYRVFDGGGAGALVPRAHVPHPPHTLSLPVPSDLYRGSGYAPRASCAASMGRVSHSRPPCPPRCALCRPCSTARSAASAASHSPAPRWRKSDLRGQKRQAAGCLPQDATFTSPLGSWLLRAAGPGQTPWVRMGPGPGAQPGGSLCTLPSLRPSLRRCLPGLLALLTTQVCFPACRPLSSPIPFSSNSVQCGSPHITYRCTVPSPGAVSQSYKHTFHRSSHLSSAFWA